MAAIAALEDKEFLQNSIDHNTKWRGWLTDELRNLGYESVDSQANFVLIKFDDAKSIYEKLKSGGIIVREMGAYNLPDYLRISIGTEEEMRALVEVLA